MPQTPGPERVPAGVRQGGRAAVSLAHRLTLFISTILFTLHLLGFLYFYSFWYLLKFFFKIPPCLSPLKEKMEHGAVAGGPNTAELWTHTLGPNPGLPLSSCVICSELLSLSETQRPHSPITTLAFKTLYDTALSLPSLGEGPFSELFSAKALVDSTSCSRGGTQLRAHPNPEEEADKAPWPWRKEACRREQGGSQREQKGSQRLQRGSRKGSLSRQNSPP